MSGWETVDHEVADDWAVLVEDAGEWRVAVQLPPDGSLLTHDQAQRLGLALLKAAFIQEDWLHRDGPGQGLRECPGCGQGFGETE